MTTEPTNTHEKWDYEQVRLAQNEAPAGAPKNWVWGQARMQYPPTFTKARIGDRPADTYEI